MRFNNTVIETLAYALPDTVMTSADIEEALAPVYERLRLPAGRLELMTGIRERRFWSRPTLASAASAEAGKAALARSRVSAAEIDVLIHAGVCRDRLEPATAAYVHGMLGLPQQTQIFDLSNACLGFLNALVVGAGMIESGLARRILVVSGENGRPLLERTLDQLRDPALTRRTIKPYFANLTIGAGCVAAVLAPGGDVSGECLRLCHAAVETDSSFNTLCQGDSAGQALEMLTDSEELLVAGIGVARRGWARFCEESGTTAADYACFVTHQVGAAHRRALYEALELPLDRDFSTFPTLGNVGSVSCPITLAMAVEAGRLRPGEQAALLGIGSGLSSLMMAVEAVSG